MEPVPPWIFTRCGARWRLSSRVSVCLLINVIEGEVRDRMELCPSEINLLRTRDGPIYLAAYMADGFLDYFGLFD